MKIALAALCSLVVLVTAGTAQAATLHDDTVAALKAKPVYVAPGTEGTTVDTAATLHDQLSEGDRILVIMLPGTALGQIGNDPPGFAQRIDQALGGANIIGLAVGEQVVAYSAALPTGVATDLMKRASSVSTSPSETLGTFIRNVHSWQRQNPEAVASQPPSELDLSGPIAFGIGAGIGLVILAVGSVIHRRMQVAASSEPRIKLRSPDEVKDILADILRLRPQVNSQSVQTLLRQVVTDTEAYFERQRRTGNPDEDVAVFQEHLRSVREVLERYIDVQDNQRYFDAPQQLMRSGEDAFGGFAQLVLDSIRRDNRQALTRYKVNTNILDAQRYR